MANFEKAARLKLRFETSKGNLSIEDLWDLPLTSKTGKVCLDAIALELHKGLQDTSTLSFVDTEKKGDETLQLKFDVVKHIIDVLKAERDAAAQAAEKKEQKQKILALIDQKQNEALSAKSEEELRAILAAI